MVEPITVITSALQAFSSTREIIKTIFALKVDAEVQSKVIALQGAIMEAQTAFMEMQRSLSEERQAVDQLRDELKTRDDWDRVLDRYKLVEAGLGQMLYESKDADPRHFICPNCVLERRASILHQRGHGGESRWCPRCDKTFQIEPLKPIRDVAGRSGGPGSWMG